MNYVEPILSARPAVITKTEDGCKVTVEVENFGRVVSKPTLIQIESNNKDKTDMIANGLIPVLKPFEKTNVELTCGNRFEAGIS